MEVQRVGGVQKEAISEGLGVASRVFCLGALSKIDEQAISYSGGSREGGHPLFVDQTEAQRAKKLFLETAPPPLSKGVDERPPLSQALDPSLHYFTFEWSFKAKSVVFIDDLLFAVG